MLTTPDCIQVGDGSLRPDVQREGLFLTVEDEKGTYTIPYIQNSGTLRVSMKFGTQDILRVQLELYGPAHRVLRAAATPKQPTVCFPDLPPGEYTLYARARDASGAKAFAFTYRHIGIGTVLAALGDSITEGYYSRGYATGDDRTASMFPPEAVSRDGRNFPQYGPTTHQYMPTVNCFESWMTGLNDLLAEAWRHPVFIANEGWGGYTSETYLNLMRTNTKWQARMRQLKPQVWLIHLGVNDERAKMPPETFARNMDAIVGELIDKYGAKPDHILIAHPSYDYFEGAPQILQSFSREIDRLIERRGLSHGPDFFDAFSRDKQKWYGDDPVHPNVAGVRYMAEQWAKAITSAVSH
jgi:lysophospholipase L1-like esterase